MDTASEGTSGGDTARGDTARGDTAAGDTASGDTARGDTAGGDHGNTYSDNSLFTCPGTALAPLAIIAAFPARIFQTNTLHRRAVK